MDESRPSIVKIAAFLLLVFAGVAHAEPYLIPPDKSIAGHTQAEWSAMWWQWAGSFDRHRSPVGDTTGALCGRKQQGPVWFLAGTYGTHRTIRTCTVPKGKYLFFPLINYVVMPSVSGDSDCKGAKRIAATMTDDASSLIFELDGVRVNSLLQHRQATRECFDMGLRSDIKVRVFPSAANGYYAMLHPLPRGTHTLNFGGALPGMLQAVTYTLEVE